MRTDPPDLTEAESWSLPRFINDDEDRDPLPSTVEYPDSYQVSTWLGPEPGNDNVNSETPSQQSKLHVTAPEGQEVATMDAISDGLEQLEEEDGVMPSHKFISTTASYQRNDEGNAGKLATIYPGFDEETKEVLEEHYEEELEEDGPQRAHNRALRDMAMNDEPEEMTEEDKHRIINPSVNEAERVASVIANAIEEHDEVDEDNMPRIGGELDEDENPEERMGETGVHARYGVAAPVNDEGLIDPGMTDEDSERSVTDDEKLAEKIAAHEGDDVEPEDVTETQKKAALLAQSTWPDHYEHPDDLESKIEVPSEIETEQEKEDNSEEDEDKGEDDTKDGGGSGK